MWFFGKRRKFTPAQKIIGFFQSSISPALWQKTLTAPPELASAGDRIWDLAVHTSLWDDKKPWLEAASLRQLYIMGRTKAAVGRHLGLKELMLSVPHPDEYWKIGKRTLAETLEAILGAYWLENRKIPIKQVREMLSFLTPEDLLPEKTDEEIVLEKYPGFKIVAEKISPDSKLWLIKFVDASENVVLVLERRRPSRAKKELIREIKKQITV